MTEVTGEAVGNIYRGFPRFRLIIYLFLINSLTFPWMVRLLHDRHVHEVYIAHTRKFIKYFMQQPLHQQQQHRNVTSNNSIYVYVYKIISRRKSVRKKKTQLVRWDSLKARNEAYTLFLWMLKVGKDLSVEELFFMGMIWVWWSVTVLSLPAPARWWGWSYWLYGKNVRKQRFLLKSIDTDIGKLERSHF